MKKLIHLRKLSAQEVNSTIKKQHAGYDLSENHKVDKDVLLMKTISNIDELHEIPLREILVSDRIVSGDTGLVVQSNVPMRTGLSTNVIERLNEKGIQTVGDMLKEADTVEGLTTAENFEIFTLIAIIEKVLKKE